MLVERIWTPAGLWELSGSGYSPDGTLTGAGDPACRPAADTYLPRLARVAAAWNDKLRIVDAWKATAPSSP